MFFPNDCTFSSFVGGTVSVSVDNSASPLPAALPLFITGLGVMGFLAKRRKSQAHEGSLGRWHTLGPTKRTPDVRAHNLKVVGSNPTPATKLRRQVKDLAAFPFWGLC
jgi:hypothetical protein